MPIVNDDLVTNAELQEFKCPGCGNWFKDFIMYKCADCEKKFWYSIILDPDWFPQQLKDGSPDWNSVKKDKPQFGTDWSYGCLGPDNKTMIRVPINREGEKFDYGKFELRGDEIEEQFLEVVRGIKMSKTTKKENKKEEAEHKQEEKKEQKELIKLIDKTAKNPRVDEQ